jgi:hypothetical protein
VGADSEQKTEMNAEGTNVSSSLAADPENTQLPLVVELVQLALVDRSDTELALDGGDERRALEESSGERLQGARKLRLASRQLVVQADDADILLSGSLLRLDETGGAVNADNEAAGDLGVESAAVTGLLDSSIVVSLLYVRMAVASVPTSACA